MGPDQMFEKFVELWMSGYGYGLKYGMAIGICIGAAAISIYCYLRTKHEDR